MRLLGAILAFILMSAHVQAATFNLFESKLEFDADTGGGTTINFSSIGNNEALTNQFQSDGLTFTENTAVGLQDFSFADFSGFRDRSTIENLIAAELNFAESQTFFGVSFLGSATIELYDGEALLISEQFGVNGPNFGGIEVIGRSFDHVRLFDEELAPGAFDSIQFGVAEVPVPPMLPAFAVVIVLGLATRKFI